MNSTTGTPDQTDDTVEVLTDALRQAAQAHGIYETEELGGVHHTEWHRWYAQHMVRSLTEGGYRLVPGRIAGDA